jgi:hypothetical protein
MIKPTYKYMNQSTYDALILLPNLSKNYTQVNNNAYPDCLLIQPVKQPAKPKFLNLNIFPVVSECKGNTLNHHLSSTKTKKNKIKRKTAENQILNRKNKTIG